MVDDPLIDPQNYTHGNQPVYPNTVTPGSHLSVTVRAQ